MIVGSDPLTKPLRIPTTQRYPGLDGNPTSPGYKTCIRNLKGVKKLTTDLGPVDEVRAALGYNSCIRTSRELKTKKKNIQICNQWTK